MPARPSDTAELAPEQQDQPTPFAGTGGISKNNSLLYAAGDVIVWVAIQNAANPPVAFEAMSSLTPAGSWLCLGWADTSGYIFKLDETIKDIGAAGVLTPIRSILTGGMKTVQCTFMEALNPYVRSLFDEVPVFPYTTSPLKPPSAPVAPQTANQAIYVIPDPPGDNRYSLLFDSVDGIKKQRLFAPNAKVTARGNDQIQQADVELTDLTFTLYPGTIGANTAAVAQRYIDFGSPMTNYFT